MKRSSDERKEKAVSSDEKEREEKKMVKRTKVSIPQRLPLGVCVKVASLRPAYSDLESWLRNEKNVLVCRSGRVFIGKGTAKHVFHYRSSEWANPFTVKDHGLDESLRLFREHLDKLLLDAPVRERFISLAEAEHIGCFCDPGAKCHRDVILEKLKSLIVD